MFIDFDNLKIGDLIFIPHNGVDEKGIVYIVYSKELGAFGGLTSFVKLVKVSSGGGFDDAELVYTPLGATILYGDGKDYTKVISCPEQKVMINAEEFAKRQEMYQIEIGSWERNIYFQVRSQYQER